MTGSLLVACPDKPDANKGGGDGSARLAPRVEFVDAPSDGSARQLNVFVKASNGDTAEYAYAVIKGTGDCHSPAYSTWRSFSVPIELTASVLGVAGSKTLCAKGRRADGAEQSQPTSHVWTLTALPTMTPTPSTTPSTTTPSTTTPSTTTPSTTTPSTTTPSTTTPSTTTPSTTTPATTTPPVTETDQSLDNDDAVEDRTEGGLVLSLNQLKFASTDKEEQLINLKNDSGSPLNWSASSKHKAGWLEMRTVAEANKDSSEGDGWILVKEKDESTEPFIQGTLNSKDTEYLQLRLADRWKTDYGGSKEIAITFKHGKEELALTVWIVVPQLSITAANQDISDVAKRVWQVTLSPSDEDKQKALIISNARGDFKVLQWQIFPYAWQPNWFDYSTETVTEADKKTDKLTLKLSDDCSLYPAADKDDELTLLIASNSDSKDVQARSFAFSSQQQDWTWQEEGETASTAKADWHTNDIRYVVVKYENTDNLACP